jgi:hypothetical protein
MVGSWDRYMLALALVYDHRSIRVLLVLINIYLAHIFITKPKA